MMQESGQNAELVRDTGWLHTLRCAISSLEMIEYSIVIDRREKDGSRNFNRKM